MTMPRTIVFRSLLTALCLCLSVAGAWAQPSGTPSSKSRQSDGVILSYEETPGMPSVEIGHTDLFTYATTPSQSIAGKELVVFGNIQPLTCTWTVLDTAELRVVFDLGEEYRLGRLIGTTASVTVNIVGYTGYPGAPGAIVISTQCTLRAGELAPEQMFRANIVNGYPFIGHFAVFVTAYNGTTVATVQNAVRLKLSCVTRWKVGGRGQFDNPYPQAASSYLQTVAPTPGMVSANPVQFVWDGYACFPNFPLYQVQILRLYNVSTASISETDIAARVDWSQALTVETSSTSLTLTVAEGRGYYLWRVRPIGTMYDGGITNPLNWGEWSSTPGVDPNDGLLHITTATALPAGVFFYEQFDDDKNWIFSRQFAEQAKMSESMTYANGLQMSEQVQRRMQSQATKIIQQTVYDYAGRAALSSLAVPYTEVSGSTTNALKYVGRASVMAFNGTRYSAQHFDGITTLHQPQPVNGGVLSSYYTASGSSPIPNAEGYPYSRALYYSDGAGRVKEQSGAGATHRMGAGHTSRTFYAAVTDQELVRIFGDEAPDPISVHKIVQYDPNTTGTVQYMSKDGKVIATALVAGNNGEPLETLNETEIFASSGGEITDYILDSGTGKTRNTKSGKTLRAGKTIVLTEPGNVYLDYELTPRAFHESCMNVCVNCDYWVYFTVFSTNDNSIQFIDSMIVNPGALLTNPSSCNNGARQYKNGMTVYLQPGSYRIERKIVSDNTVPAEKIPYLEWHKQTIASEVRSRFNALNGGQGLDSVLTRFLSDTATAPLSEFYDYMNAHFGGLAFSFGCSTITVPYYACPKTKCQEGNYDFELYLRTRLNVATTATLGHQFEPDAGDVNPAYQGLRDLGWGKFNAVIQNMLADGYNCDKLWECWEAALEMKASMSDPALASAYTDAGQEFSLMDAFLDCTGRKFAGVTTDQNLYLSKPYMYFRDAMGADGRYTECYNVISSHYGVPSDTADWEMLYRCWTRELPPPDQPHDIGSNIAQLRDSCLSLCEMRATGFRREIIRTFLEMNPNLDTNSIPIDCILDSLVKNCEQACYMIGPVMPEWVYKKIANFTTAGFDFEIPSTVIPACSQGYELIGRRQVTPAMLMNQIKLINAVLIDYQNQILTNGPTPALMDSLESILRTMIYDLIRESSNCLTITAPPQYVYASRIVNQILTLWQQGMLQNSRVQLYLNGCRLEMRTGSYLKSPCLYEVEQDSVYYDEPLDSAIVYNPCLTRVPPMNEVIVLCNDMCVWSTGCAICVHWIDPAEITTSIVSNKHAFTPKTCKEDFAAQIKVAIQQQLQTIIEERQRSIENLYKEWCMMPERMDEVFKVRYKMRMYHYTLYYYDRAGNLVRTVPPAGVKYVNSRAEQPAHTYVTKYKYNSLRQLIWQETPDGGATSFLYNDKGQLRLSRNAKQNTAPKKYSYSKYDALGRILEVGEVDYNSDYTASLDDIGTGSFPTAGSYTLRERTLTYYSSSAAGITYLNDGVTTQRYLQNRVSYSISDADGNTGTTNDQVQTTYSYDPHGNVQWLVQSVPGAPAKYLRYEYDLFSGNVVRLLYNENREDRFLYRYEYDEDNRIRLAATSRDGYIWEIDAQYSYYEHSPLRRVVLGEDRVQGVDYTYTIHGWLKALNHASLLATDDPGGDGGTGTNAAVARDAFGMILGYYQGDFNKSGSAFHSTASGRLWDNTRPRGGSLYNGNIASWETKTGSTAGNTQYAQYTTGHVYRYDLLNRIKAAKFRYDNSGWQVPAGSAYNTAYTYDPNGNITALERYAHNGLMDQLTYSYYGTTPAPTNRLSHVADVVAAGSYSVDIDNQSGGNYTYDATGNLTGDAAEGLTIEWTVYGKVKQVTDTDGKVIKFLYDANGNRVRKEVTGSGTTGENATTWYTLTPDGRALAVHRWSGQTADSVEVEYSLYGSDRLGQRHERFNAGDRNVATAVVLVREDVHSGGLRYTRRIDRSIYELKDHLGNVRVVVGDIKEPQPGGEYLADVKSYANYYAFGMEHPERCWSGDEYRYGFGGHEKENEIKGSGNHYSFGDYGYDPRVGRRWNLDPKFMEIAGLSPYVYSLNNPNVYKDPDGKLPILPLLLKAGANGAADMLTQAAMAYFFDPSVETIGQAFDKVNWWQVTRSAAEGILPWSTPGGRLGRAAVTATGDVLVNALDQGSSYTQEKALQDFAVGFIGDLAGGGLGELVSRYGTSGVAKGLAKMGFNGDFMKKHLGVSDFQLGVLARERYNEIVGTIDNQIAGLKSLKEKARKAYDIRHEARMEARDISGSANKAAAEARDQEKYGNKYGPTFEELFKKNKDKGLSDDEAYRQIIESSKRTDPGTNEKYKK